MRLIHFGAFGLAAGLTVAGVTGCATKKLRPYTDYFAG